MQSKRTAHAQPVQVQRQGLDPPNLQMPTYLSAFDVIHTISTRFNGARDSGCEIAEVNNRRPQPHMIYQPLSTFHLDTLLVIA
jgi:hypothetical protein